jgi:adenylate kinase
MNLIFIGIQGSGKGTQAQIVSKELGLCHISTGDLVRGATGELKEEISTYMNFGKLVPDELITKLLSERIKGDDCRKGIILDGYPRNVKQIKLLDSILKIDKVIEIRISDEEAIKRMKGRWNCKKCNLSYNYATMPKPKVLGICDKCSGKLEQRKDDSDDRAIEERLKIYKEETFPILEHYKHNFVNGEQTIKQVTEDIIKILNN